MERALASSKRGGTPEPARRPGQPSAFGVPIVATVSEAAGVGHVLATDAVVVDTDSQGVGVQWSETSNSDDFAKNLIRARVWGRFGTSVLSPLGVQTRVHIPPHSSQRIAIPDPMPAAAEADSWSRLLSDAVLPAAANMMTVGVTVPSSEKSRGVRTRSGLCT